MTITTELLKENTQKQYGENGHVEYGWSNNIRERIIQLNFQLTRTTENCIQYLENIYYGLLYELFYKYYTTQYSLEKEICVYFLKLLYKMIGYTRDIIDGKGECTLTYMMIFVWYNMIPELACYALSLLVQFEDSTKIHPYGSWKDIKYFCHFCKSKGLQENHFLIIFAVNLINDKLKVDYDNYLSGTNNISLAAKWVPRETSRKFGWLNKTLATHFYSHYLMSALDETSFNKAVSKSKMDYRKLISTLNKKLDTLQIKQCASTWSTIEFNHVTSISLARQKNALLNIHKNGNKKKDCKDRNFCAEKFKHFVEKSLHLDNGVQGKRIALNEFTKQALDLIHTNQDKSISANILNAQWKDHSSQNMPLNNVIALVDVSDSMNIEQKNAAIALGIRIAEKSTLGKRMIAFSSSSQWVNLESCEHFVDCVKKFKESTEYDYGTNANFFVALDMILDAFIETKMSPEDVQDLMLVVLSDMQIDPDLSADSTSKNNNNMHAVITKKYEEAGIKVHGKQYKNPHILFWNLRSTNGFPTLHNQQNCSMVSGFNPSALNLFCEKGDHDFQASTPWSIFMKSLENNRYKPLEKKCLEILMQKNEK